MPSDYSRIREDNIREYGEGTRHLAFLGSLYTDRTHFIFELLQNAEDVRASRIRFRLFEDRLEVTHDGRLFNEPDVWGVCGVGKGTKSGDLTQIGKFGIGFKSVYAYTSTPEIHSGEESFVIEDYVRPSYRNPRKLEDPWNTLFVLPFNAAGLDPETARQEIAERLRNLSARTLLFLRSIEEIRYELPEGTNGEYLREEVSRGSGRHITVIGQNDGQEEDENWLVFERPVMAQDGGCKVRVEAGFCLETNMKDKTESISRITDAPLIVYFPTEKETRLGFLIQGPYRTTPARDNIPRNDAFNQKLIEETAELVVESLRQLKEMSLLSVPLLEALPIRTVDFPENGMFYPIFSRVREALLSEELLPANDGTFVAAPNARLVRGIELTNLLNQDQLRALFQSDDEIKWLTGEITENQTPDLHSYLMNEMNIDEVDPGMFARKLSEEFLCAQTDEWFIVFYSFLSGQKALWQQRWSVLRNKPILRLQNGSHANPFRSDNSPTAYLATDTETSLPIVKVTLSSDEEAGKFLQELGVPKLDIVEEVIGEILPKYTGGSVTIGPEENEHDLKKIERAYKTDSAEKKNRLRDALRKTTFILAECPNKGEKAYREPEQVYFSGDELRMYFSGNDSFACVSHDHLHAKLLKELDVKESVSIQKKTSDTRGCIIIKSGHSCHERGFNGFDPDIRVDGLECAISTPTQEKSAFIWNEIAVPNSDCIRGFVEKSTRQTYENSTKSEQTSEKFGRLLINTAWLPDPDGHLRKPSDLALDDLPESFDRDVKLADQLGMKKNVVAKLAEEAGISKKTLDCAKQIENASPEARQKIDSILQGENKPSFPQRSSVNSERRQERLAEELVAAPEKEYQPRERSVRTTREEIDPDTWLKERYANDSDQIICQICKNRMPFRKRDGEYYFETVEALSKEYLSKEHEAQFLALCPLCAAMYKEFVKRDQDAMKAFYDALKSSDKPEVPLALGEWETLRFVETHWQDMKKILQLTQPEAAVGERGDTWNEQDQEDLTTASLRYAATRYPEEDLV